ncbi:ParB N-terminal domain-containing protein [Anaerotruncus colihominis]|uniref:ParB N-terminal domain-containing protein n=1 Tax=Anaerotruncus colihominis TaxID=169435 RepID=UPI001177AD48|nr:ParB N-terminal domain-containing protein [Anaerotruncus colihominis]MCQ4735239.1 ParB N-terminal domain-containing protein [Anaerotruncus colihominis]
MNLQELTPAEYNPRVELKPGDPEWEALNESIQEFDYILPIIWNENTGNIVGGHQRRNILLERGVEEEDVVVLHLTEEEEKILNVLLNKVKGIWDVTKLVDLITEIKEAGGNLKATGFTELEISLMGEDFGHIEDLLNEDFSDVGKKESDTFVATFTLPEEQHQRVNRFVEDYGKLALSKAVMDKVKGLV